MTSTELIKKTIRHEATPRTPAAVLDGYNWFLKQNNMTADELYAMPADRAAAFILEQYQKMGSDLVYVGPLLSAAVREVMTEQAGQTPPLSTPEDISRFSLPDIYAKAERRQPFLTMGRLLNQLNQQLAGTKPILAFATGPLTSAAGLLGMEPLMMALHEDPDALERLLDFCTDLTILQLKSQLSMGATGVSIADPVSAVNLISEDFFERFSLPRIRRIAAVFAGTDMPVMLHICGASSPRIAALVGSGINIYSMDEVDLAYAQAAAKQDFAIFGNLSTFAVMLAKSPEEIYALGKERCETAKTGFILAPGCDLPPDTPVENLKAMFDAAKSTRKPKISLNPDKDVVQAVKEGLKQKDGYCPCRLAKTEENKCMCKEFREQIADPNFVGFCHCMLYYKSYEENENG